jgi:hypothetical protein
MRNKGREERKFFFIMAGSGAAQRWWMIYGVSSLSRSGLALIWCYLEMFRGVRDEKGKKF